MEKNNTMDKNLFSRFVPVINSLSPAELAGSPSLYKKLELASTENLQVCYAPFEHINPNARVVIVGITPGRQQMLKALGEARRQLVMGSDDLQVLKAAKSVGSFSGDIRTHLVSLLDNVGINSWLGISSCSALFGNSALLVQTTSALRNPVFLKGKDYNGTPNMTRNPMLREQLLTHFAEDVRALPNAVFVPLGGKVAEALQFLADRGYLNKNQILDGLPHPSPQNIERIRYFLGQKPKQLLSAKTNGDAIDAARSSILSKVLALA
jgi:hypothetical protein